MPAARPMARHRPTPTRPRILIGRPAVPANVTCPLLVIPVTAPAFTEITGELDSGGGLLILGPYLPPGFILTSPADVPPDDPVPDSTVPYAEDGP